MNKKLKETLKSYWETQKRVTRKYYEYIRDIEESMEKETKIKGIEFFWSDNEIVGIGTADRSMKLMHGVDLE